MKRRNFFNIFPVLGLTFLNPNIVHAKENNEMKMLFVFLRGGADGLNMVVPHNDSVYYDLRKKIHIKKENQLEITTDFAINSKLKDSFYDSFKKNEAIFIPTSGQLHNSRSHFLSQKVMHFGVENRENKTGFLNRLLEITNLQGISFTKSKEIIFNGNVNVPNISLRDISYFLTPEIELEIFNNLNKDKLLLETYKSLLSTKYNLLRLKNNNEPDYNDIVQFKRVAKYMDMSQSNIGYIELESWDTHHEQISAFNDLLENLNSCLVAYKENTKSWNNTLVFIFSEFGRTVKENGGLGTEHGHGNLVTILGGGIKKSKILGDWVPLNKLHENRDLFVLHEYKSILAKLFSEVYGLNKNQLDYVFPNTSKESFNIII